MNYQDYTLEDFITDAYFRKWVNDPDEESTAFWYHWLEQHPEKRKEVAQARQLVSFLRFREDHLSEKDAREIWQQVEAAQHVAHPSRQRSWTLSVAPHFRAWQKIAALWAGILLVTAVFLLYDFHSTTSYTTQFGETKSLFLPDSSRVILNANSTLRYATEWTDQKPREVFLEGEAFFEVREKPTKGNAKFVVHTQQLDVEVLGTKFNVNQRRNRTQVVLNTGSVRLKVDQPSPEVIMLPGEMVEYADSKAKFVKKQVDPELYTSWRENELIFVRTPLSDIAQMLEDNYGLQLVFQTPDIKQKRFTGSSPADSVHLLFHTWEQLFGLQITKSGKQIIIADH